MAKNARNLPGNVVQDPGAIANLEYNNASGSKKVSEVGRRLLAIPTVTANVLTYTTDASTARVLPSAGRNLAIYNNSAAIHAVTLGEDNTVVALAAGVTDTAGHVGIPCTPNSWTYVACGPKNWVKTDSATLLVFLIDDLTKIAQEAATYQGN